MTSISRNGPIGQPKSEILARFDATLLPYDDGFQNAAAPDLAYRDFVKGCWQLLLMPKANTPDSERFREIRLWYAPDAQGRILPKMAFTIDRKGDESFVQLIGTVVNEPLPDGVIDMTEPDEAQKLMLGLDIEQVATAHHRHAGIVDQQIEWSTVVEETGRELPHGLEHPVPGAALRTAPTERRDRADRGAHPLPVGDAGPGPRPMGGRAHRRARRRSSIAASLPRCRQRSAG